MLLVSAKIFGAKRIYKALQRDQKEGEGKAIEINITSLVKLLRDMAIQAPTTKANHSS